MGGGIIKDLFDSVAYLIRISLDMAKRDSNRAMDGDGSQFKRIWSIIGDMDSAYFDIPTGSHLILVGVRSIVGAFDSGMGGLGG